MRTQLITIIPIMASSLLLLGALSSPAVAAEDKAFGCTVRQNIEVQTVDMDPRYEGKLMEGGVGNRSTAAVRRYQTDKIRPLIRVDGRTQVGAQGGAASGGGN